MKTILSFLTISTLVLCSPCYAANSIKAKPTFFTLFLRVPAKQRAKAIKIINDLTAKIENQKRSRSARIWNPFLSPAHAEGSVWCVNNGFIAQVESCDRTNRWSFDVREIPDFQFLTQSGLSMECSEEQSPCSPMAGINASGGLYCSNNSTNQCLSQGTGEGVQRLSTALQQCNEGQTEITVGSRAVQCGPLKQVIQSQLTSLESNCSEAVQAVRNVCEKSRVALSALSGNSPTPLPNPSAPSEGAADIVYVGDSHSVGCFGQNLHKNMKNLGTQLGGAPLRVRTVATCGSSASSWLKSTHRPACNGLRNCPVNGDCQTSESGHAPSLSSLVQENKPKAVVIALGTNMMAHNATWTSTENSVSQLIAQVPTGTQCVWVGPPQVGPRTITVANYDNFVRQMEIFVTSKGCKFVDSGPYTHRNQVDSSGYHYSCAKAGAWADNLFGGSAQPSSRLQPGLGNILSGMFATPAATHNTSDTTVQ